MSISPAQSRGARAFLEWTQDQLAENAQVTRATIADFERNIRQPGRNNMISIINAFEAAGIEFLDEREGGAGIKFRKVEIEYRKDFLPFGDDLILQVRYRGSRYKILLRRDVIDDVSHGTFDTFEEKSKAVGKDFPIYLRAAEKALISGHSTADKVIELTQSNF